MNRLTRCMAILAVTLAIPVAAQGQAPVIVVNLADLTGAAAVAGTNFNNGVQLAFKEINAAGGILKQRIQLVTFDTETNRRSRPRRWRRRPSLCSPSPSWGRCSRR